MYTYFFFISFCDIKASEKEETLEEEKPAPEVNGHAEEVEEEKSKQVKDKEESASNTSAGIEVLAELCIRLFPLAEVLRAVLPDQLIHRDIMV